MSNESLRRAGRAELDRLNAAAVPGAKPPKAKKKRVTTTWRQVLGIGQAKERRVGPAGETVDEAVDRAVKGAKRDPY